MPFIGDARAWLPHLLWRVYLLSAGGKKTFGFRGNLRTGTVDVCVNGITGGGLMGSESTRQKRVKNGDEVTITDWVGLH